MFDCLASCSPKNWFIALKNIYLRQVEVGVGVRGGGVSSKTACLKVEKSLLSSLSSVQGRQRREKANLRRQSVPTIKLNCKSSKLANEVETHQPSRINWKSSCYQIFRSIFCETLVPFTQIMWLFLYTPEEVNRNVHITSSKIYNLFFMFIFALLPLDTSPTQILSKRTKSSSVSTAFTRPPQTIIFN